MLVSSRIPSTQSVGVWWCSLDARRPKSSTGAPLTAGPPSPKRKEAAHSSREPSPTYSVVPVEPSYWSCMTKSRTSSCKVCLSLSLKRIAHHHPTNTREFLAKFRFDISAGRARSNHSEWEGTVAGTCVTIGFYQIDPTGRKKWWFWFSNNPIGRTDRSISSPSRFSCHPTRPCWARPGGQCI